MSALPFSADPATVRALIDVLARAWRGELAVYEAARALIADPADLGAAAQLAAAWRDLDHDRRAALEAAVARES